MSAPLSASPLPGLCSICYLQPSTGTRDNKPICAQCDTIMAQCRPRHLVSRPTRTASGKRLVYVCSNEPVGRNQPAAHATGCDTCRTIVTEWLNTRLGPSATPDQRRQLAERQALAELLDPPIGLREAS